GNASAWSATRSFSVDGTAPVVLALVGPAGGARIASLPALAATYSDPGAGAGASGTLTFQVCRASGCAVPVASGVSSGLVEGATAAWTPADLADGSYSW